MSRTAQAQEPSMWKASPNYRCQERRPKRGRTAQAQEPGMWKACPNYRCQERRPKPGTWLCCPWRSCLLLREQYSTHISGVAGRSKTAGLRRRMMLRKSGLSRACSRWQAGTAAIHRASEACWPHFTLGAAYRAR